MTISTTTADARLKRSHGLPWAYFALMLPGLLLLPAGKSIRKRALWLAAGVVLLLTFMVAGCSSSGSGGSSGGSQNYSVVVTASATGAASGNTTISVTVTK
jgi:hypothetical protein